MLQTALKEQSRKWTLQEYDSDDDENVDQLTVHEAFQVRVLPAEVLNNLNFPLHMDHLVLF